MSLSGACDDLVCFAPRINAGWKGSRPSRLVYAYSNLLRPRKSVHKQNCCCVGAGRIFWCGFRSFAATLASRHASSSFRTWQCGGGLRAGQSLDACPALLDALSYAACLPACSGVLRQGLLPLLQRVERQEESGRSTRGGRERAQRPAAWRIKYGSGACLLDLGEERRREEGRRSG